MSSDPIPESSQLENRHETVSRSDRFGQPGTWGWSPETGSGPPLCDLPHGQTHFSWFRSEQVHGDAVVIDRQPVDTDQNIPVAA